VALHYNYPVMVDPLSTPLTTKPIARQSDAVLREDGTLDPTAKKPRTFGLKMVDRFIYGMNYVVVTGLSVTMTYITNLKGEREPTKGFLAGIHQRGKIFTDQITEGWTAKNILNKVGISFNQTQADEAKIVAFSFADGLLFLPAVWGMEQFREKAGRKIDELAGTLPEDMSAYDTEPKQSFLSVLGGRMATLLVVLPVAMSLSKTGTDQEGKLAWKTEENEHGFNSFNDHLFNNPGKKLAEGMNSLPAINDKVNQHNIDVANLGRAAAFEGFYTGVCTVSQYCWSRLIAGLDKHKKDHDIVQAKPCAPRNHATIAPTLHQALAAKHDASVPPQPYAAPVPQHKVESVERKGTAQDASPALVLDTSHASL
jgi:hypothetical protein